MSILSAGLDGNLATCRSEFQRIGKQVADHEFDHVLISENRVKILDCILDCNGFSFCICR